MLCNFRRSTNKAFHWLNENYFFYNENIMELEGVSGLLNICTDDDDVSVAIIMWILCLPKMLCRQ